MQWWIHSCRKYAPSLSYPTVYLEVYKQTRGLVSKETVVLRRWGRKTQNFGFID